MKHAFPRRGWVYLAFAASGASALVLQLVWTRWLTLALGAGTQATTIVLATFMGGLGAGSWLGGRLADGDPRRSLRRFALAEIALAGWALGSIAWVPDGLPALAAAMGASPPVRVLLAVLTLAPATLLMGVTLPLLARWITDCGRAAGRGIGLLYAVNTLGAASGALLAVFHLIPQAGLAGAAALAAGVDLAAGAVCLILASRLSVPAERAARTARASGPAPPTRLMAVVGGAYFLSGVVGLGLEVTVFRMLAVLADSTVYAHAVMLAAFLFGLAAGSAVVAWRAERLASPGVALGLTLAGAGLGVGVALQLAHREPWSLLGRSLGILGEWAYRFELAGFLLLLLPATLMLGAAVPLVGRLAAADPQRLGRRFGGAYALNALGAVAGGVAASSWLVPALGTARTMLLLALLAAVGGLSVIALTAAPTARRVPLVAAGLLGAIGVLLGAQADPVRHNLAAIFGVREPLFFREGPVQTLAVLRDDNERLLPHLRMVTDRSSLTGTNLYAQRYMTLLGHLPVLWAEETDRALVICYGTGMTAGAVARYPSVREIDIVEISADVLDAAPLFGELSHGVLDDPRVEIHLEDGRQLMLVGGRDWDVITLEPPPPRDSGVVSLYTTDFYRLARRRLRPGGVIAQWIPLHSQSQQETRMLVRAFVDSFPHALGFVPVERELLLLGSESELAIDPRRMAERMAPAAVRGSLAQRGFASPFDLLATALVDRDGLDAFAGDAPPVTDDRPAVEYFAAFGKRAPRPDPAGLLLSPPRLDALIGRAATEAEADAFLLARKALLASLHAAWTAEKGDRFMARELALRAVRLRPADPYYLWAAQLSDEHLARMRGRAESGRDYRLWASLGVRYAQRGEEDDAFRAFVRAQQLRPDHPEVLLRLGLLLISRDEHDRGRPMLERFLRLAPTHPAAAEVERALRDGERAS